MSNIFTWIATGVALFALSGVLVLWTQNSSLTTALNEATREIEILKKARDLSESLLNEQLKREHEVNAKRKETQKKLDEAANSDTDDLEFMDSLMWLLEHNNEDSGSPTTAKSH